MKFWNMKNADSAEPELYIEGEIKVEQDLWDWFTGATTATSRGLVGAIRSVGNRDLTVWVDSPGGDVLAGTAIYTALCEQRARYGSKITVKVVNAISAAHVLSMAGDHVLWSPVALGMMHNPYTRVEGEAKDLEQGAEILNRVKDTLITAYTRKTGKSREEVSELMDAETWMTAQQAVEWGFADGLLYEDADAAPVVPASVLDYVAGARRIYNYSRDSVVNAARLRQLCQPIKGNNPMDASRARLRMEEARYGGMKNA